MPRFPSLIKKRKFQLEPGHKKKTSKTVLRFASLGTTLGASIGLGVFAGRYIDEALALQKPFGTAVGALGGLAAGMAIVLRDIKKK